MNEHKLLEFNNLIHRAYECLSFEEFLKLSIMRLHTLVMYDSGMFFCAISRDCSFFKPYISGRVEDYYQRESFSNREAYLAQKEVAGNEALVYKAADYSHGLIQIQEEPRSDFLAAQEQFHIVCMRIVYNGQFLGEIYLHRGKEKPDFDEEDLFIIRLLQPHVSAIFHLIHSASAISYIETENGNLQKKGLCLFDSEINLLSGNVTGFEMLKNTTLFGSSVLYHIKEMIWDMRSEHGYKNAAVFKSTALKVGSGELIVDIFFKADSHSRKNERFFLSMEFKDEKQSASEYKFKFTKREADIIDGIIQGKNNAQISEMLNISENTIKTHLQNIYQKVGVNNRAGLVYILMLNQTPA